MNGLSARERRPDYLASALGIGVATGVYGFSFGVLAVGSGLSVAQTCAMSLLVFTGGSQFAAVGVLGVGGSTGAAVSGALLLGARNTAYGLSVAPLLPRSLLRRALASHLIIDESTAMARAQPDPVAARGAFSVSWPSRCWPRSLWFRRLVGIARSRSTRDFLPSAWPPCWFGAERHSW